MILYNNFSVYDVSTKWRTRPSFTGRKTKIEGDECVRDREELCPKLRTVSGQIDEQRKAFKQKIDLWIIYCSLVYPHSNQRFVQLQHVPKLETFGFERSALHVRSNLVSLENVIEFISAMVTFGWEIMFENLQQDEKTLLRFHFNGIGCIRWHLFTADKKLEYHLMVEDCCWRQQA